MPSAPVPEFCVPEGVPETLTRRQVWQATDTQLNRDVALKILPDAFAADPAACSSSLVSSPNDDDWAPLFSLSDRSS